MTITEQENLIRAIRNRALRKSDWRCLGDAQKENSEWINYRQALRDITSQPGFPSEVVWPEEPA